MKLLLRGFTIYIATLLIAALIQSCCVEDHKIVGKGTIAAYQYASGNDKIETVSGIFEIRVRLELKTSMLMDNINLIQKSYAMSCDENFKNMIDPSTLKITCDKDFALNNTTIAAGNNFKDVDGLEIGMRKEWGIIDISFTQDFIDMAKFSKDTHQFTIDIETTDGLKFTNHLDLYMNL